MTETETRKVVVRVYTNAGLVAYLFRSSTGSMQYSDTEHIILVSFSLFWSCNDGCKHLKSHGIIISQRTPSQMLDAAKMQSDTCRAGTANLVNA